MSVVLQYRFRPMSSPGLKGSGSRGGRSAYSGEWPFLVRWSIGVMERAVLEFDGSDDDQCTAIKKLEGYCLCRSVRREGL